MTPSNEPEKVDFIHNPQFVDWVLKPTDLSNQFWEAYLSENPSRKKELDHARFLLKGLLINEHSLTEAEVLALWDKIEKTKSTRSIKLIYLKRWTAAAGILLLLGLSGWLMSRQGSQKTSLINYQSIATNIDPGNDIKLILSDQSQKTFSAKEVELKYNQEGKLETKTGKQVQTEHLTQMTKTIQMNQLVVPRGKRSSIELSDGTKLWLNSGSRAIYPVTFNGKTREIYIEGEGYLEVAPDASKPFYVVTDLIKVKVIGTKFDISAYKDDDRVSVVLVEGSVQASSPTEHLMMKPNQIMNYEKQTQKSTLEETNVLEYISWKDGWMLCNKEQIQSITTKLSRYYNIKINYSDTRLNNLTLTGKLDLKSNCEDVFKVICTTAPLKYEIKENTIYLKPKE
jgi:hypothetical protein